MSAQRQDTVKRITAPEITARKGKVPVVCLTAHTAPVAEILDEHCDVLLVGDSVGMVIHGLPNTLKREPAYYTRDWTDGCIAVSNSDMIEIWLLTNSNTPIDIVP